jgi:hypothetical protein
MPISVSVGPFTVQTVPPRTVKSKEFSIRGDFRAEVETVG